MIVKSAANKRKSSCGSHVKNAVQRFLSSKKGMHEFCSRLRELWGRKPNAFIGIEPLETDYLIRRVRRSLIMYDEDELTVEPRVVRCSIKQVLKRKSGLSLTAAFRKHLLNVLGEKHFNPLALTDDDVFDEALNLACYMQDASDSALVLFVTEYEECLKCPPKEREDFISRTLYSFCDEFNPYGLSLSICSRLPLRALEDDAPIGTPMIADHLLFRTSDIRSCYMRRR